MGENQGRICRLLTQTTISNGFAVSRERGIEQWLAHKADDNSVKKINKVFVW